MSVGSTPSLNFIGDTVGDTAPHSMSEMRGIRFASGNSPTTGPISLSNFRNQVLNNTVYQQAKLKASDAEFNDDLGWSASISADGSYAIVGAPARESSFGNDGSGAAYIFKRTNASWAQQAKIRSSDIQAGDRFGRDVAISGDGLYAVVGAYAEDTGGTNTGSAYIFKRTNSSWAQQAKIQASDKQEQDRFGESVSISGDGSYAIVGAYGEDTGGSFAGAAYIFKRTNSSWAQQAKIQASDKQANDLYGEAVAISSDGSYAVVGAPTEDNYKGSAYIYKRTDSSWAQQAKIQASDKTYLYGFGRAVAISSDGSYLIVGSSGEDTIAENSGAVYIFKRTDSSWAQQAKIKASDPERLDTFGAAVSISGDGSYAIAGSSGDDTGGDSAGAAYILKRTNSSWSQQKIQASDKQAIDIYGHSVSISEDSSYIIVGASNEGSSGAAYTYNNGYYI